MSRVVAAGHVNWDVTLRVDALPEPDGEAEIVSQRRSGGGSAANVACALAGFDIDAGLVGSVGDDEHGLLAQRELQAAGVDLAGLRVVDGLETSVKYLLVDSRGEVMVLGNDGANEAVAPGDLDPAVVGADCEHVHLTSQRPATAARLTALAREHDATVSFDPGRRLRDRDYGDALARTDILFVNDNEAGAVLDDDGGPTAPDSDRVVVVKHGSDGATVHTPSGSVTHPGFAVDPVDTTGAGDAFAAGFVAVVLDGGDHERALEFGNACGALAAQHEGARTAPTRADAASFLDSQF
ncbi:carbohydrate kinase family protein [Halobacterium sp. MBLA0001]|nr:carbohydrate kinase family protein [Halobacterium salinarum]MCF2167609.1 carbohydrate kinase family protein [Halobacterium salinarum]MCF2207093.1 carbohydrate kinase family protein [Halobacterium salinarum]MDL0129094.1 carbohydrate kinase family protein [Halobacterium salinarum]MDL0135096.1 carbohydrate kinase family protein [Halobacterium salinarum]